MTQLVRSCLVVLVGLLLGLGTPSIALPVPMLAAPSCVYDGAHLVSALTYTASERGPPTAAYDYLAESIAVVDVSHGTSARNSGTSRGQTTLAVGASGYEDFVHGMRCRGIPV